MKILPFLQMFINTAVIHLIIRAVNIIEFKPIKNLEKLICNQTIIVNKKPNCFRLNAVTMKHVIKK